MRIHFKTRALARAYAASKGTKQGDAGLCSPVGKRWHCEAVIASKTVNVQPQKKTVIVVAPQRENEYDITNRYSASLDAWRAGRKNTKPNNSLFK